MKLYFEDINSYIGKTTKYLIKEISRPEPETISRYGLSSDTESFRYHGIDRGWGILITNWNEEPSKENILKYGFDSIQRLMQDEVVVWILPHMLIVKDIRPVIITHIKLYHLKFNYKISIQIN